MMKRTALLALILPLSLTLQAKEGMWLPTVLASIEDDMQAMGLQLTAEDIYSVNQGSLKDAIVLFGGGCTAEVISKEGLILTNHHCGFGAIQSHSSLEHDHLKNGFWAGDRAAELMNEGLTATFVVRMEDVTSRMMEAIAGASDEAARESALAEVAEKLVAEATAEGHLNAVIRAFNYGNSYLLIVTETYRDVRLVGAPPSGIGKFGGDTDNWMWPRHTGDFSLFRIYAGPDNLPADPAPTNVPFRPRHSLPIALDGVKEGDFAMIFGFPGRTQRYLSSYEVRHIMERQDPLRIRMRKASLAVIDQAMRSDDRTRIQYAAKQSRISNAYKKWIGELRGLKELDALDQKRALEQEYQRRADSAGVDRFQEVLAGLEGIQREVAPYSDARDLFVEFVYYGPEVLRFAERFRQVAEDWEQLEEDGKLDAELEKLRKGAQAHFKDYDRDVDRRVFKALLPLFREAIAPELAPEFLSTVQSRFKGDTDAYVDALYEETLLASEEDVMDLLDGWNKRAAKQVAADPAYTAARSCFTAYLERVRPEYERLGGEQEVAMRTYVEGLSSLFPERVFWPDANSTLRLSYGRVEGSKPRDAVTYLPFTTLDGVVDKHVLGDPEFDVPARLLELHAAKDFGPYGEEGTMPVCFTASLHTTGGNSGSPVLDGRGRLIGLNFDRSWESTMSDILFDPAKCRNIAVDIRYVLFIVDKFAGAGHLVAEMELQSDAEAMRTIELPIHR